MAERDQSLERIAAALERLVPEASEAVDWTKHPAYIWSVNSAHAIEGIDAVSLERLHGIEKQKEIVSANFRRLADGAAAHDTLLWGARGMGKSALVRAAVHALQHGGADIALVQVGPEGFSSIPKLVEALAKETRAFLIFIDDLGFHETDLQQNLALRSLLDGGVLARPSHIKVVVTSNRRAIVERSANGPETLHERDERDNALALADRFGLTVAFHPCDHQTYLEILRAYTDPLEICVDENQANSWAIARGNRSGRTAFQYACELAGRAGLSL